MDIVGCDLLGFENWEEGLLDYSSSGLFTDLPTEKIFKSTLGLELNCKPLDGEKCPVNLLKQYSASGDLASREEIFPRTSEIGQVMRGQLDNAHAEQITHPSRLVTESLLETNAFMISHESQQKGYPASPRILEANGGSECLILHVKGSNASSANRNKRKKVFHDRSQLAESEKDQRNIYRGEGSDGKQISGGSPVSNTCWELEGTFVKEISSTKNDLTEDHVQAKTKSIQLTNNHSRAERIRREKISERMKFLQDIVPGCSKIIGKAAMLDEIINYVLSLQQQIEFLSRKVAIVSPDVNLDNQQILSRDANRNMINYLQDGSRSMFIGPGGPKRNSFRTIQDEFSHGTLLDTQNLNHLKVLLPQASMWNNDNPSSSKAAAIQYSWSNC